MIRAKRHHTRRSGTASLDPCDEKPLRSDDDIVALSDLQLAALTPISDHQSRCHHLDALPIAKALLLGDSDHSDLVISYQGGNALLHSDLADGRARDQRESQQERARATHYFAFGSGSGLP